MKIAVLTRKQDAFSMIICRDRIVGELERLGVVILPFSANMPVPDRADLIWEPSLSGSRVPLSLLRDGKRPLIATVHGADWSTLSAQELYSRWRGRVYGRLQAHRVLKAWGWFSKRVGAVATVSHYAAKEVSAAYGIVPHKLHTIYHGIDHHVFTVGGEQVQRKRPYLLQIAQYRPKKNVNRVIQAYTQLPAASRPDFVLIMPGYKKEQPDIPGLKLITEAQSPTQLATWYRGALFFIFPSLHETFGMPIIEAMACGCPVITSNITACPEVAGRAAWLVKPRSVDAIRNAMTRLNMDNALRQELRQKGLQRAAQFSWQKSAQAYYDLFERVLLEESHR